MSNKTQTENYRAQLEILKYRDQKQWALPVPSGNKRSELEITRGATKEPDAVPLFQPMTRLQKQIVSLCAVALFFFLLLWLMTEIW